MLLIDTPVDFKESDVGFLIEAKLTKLNFFLNTDSHFTSKAAFQAAYVFTKFTSFMRTVPYVNPGKIILG